MKKGQSKYPLIDKTGEITFDGKPRVLVIRDDKEIIDETMDIKYVVEMDIAKWGIKEFNVYPKGFLKLYMADTDELLEINLDLADNETELLGGYSTSLIILGLYLSELHITIDGKNVDTVCIVDIVGG